MPTELPELTAMQAIHVGPGDVIVMRCTEYLSIEQVERLASTFREVFGDRNKVLILDGGASLDVLDRG